MKFPVALLDAFPVGVALIDAKGCILQANPMAERLLGLRRGQQLGWMVSGGEGKIVRLDGSPLPPDEFPPVRALGEGQVVRDVEMGLAGPDGARVWLSVTGVPAGKGQVAITFMDIGERVREERIRKARNRLVEGAAGFSLEGFLQSTLDELEVLTDSTIGFSHFVEEDQETLHLQAWSTQTEAKFCRAEGKGTHYPVSLAGIWADAVREAKPFIYNEYATTPERKGLPEGHAVLLRLLVVPVIRNGKIKAVLGVGNKPTPYDAVDLDVVQRLADLTWELAAMKVAKEMAEHRSNQLEMISNAVPGVIHAMRRAPDGTTSFDSLTPAAEDLFGFPMAVLKAYPGAISDRNHHEDQDRIIGAIAASGRDLTFLHERWRYNHPSKGWRWFEGWSLPRREPDGGTIWHGFVMDITALMETERALAASQNLFENAFDCSPHGMVIVNLDGQYLKVNQAFCKMLGRTEEEICCLGIRGVTRPEDQERDFRFIEELICGQKKTIQIEKRYLHADGHEIWAEVSATFIGGRRENSLNFVTQIHDISERKRAENALLESETRFRLVFEKSAMGIAIVDAETGRFLAVNPHMGHILGYSQAELLDRSFQEISHPVPIVDDWAGIEQFRSGNGPGLEKVERYLHKSGNTVWGAVKLTNLPAIGASPSTHLVLLEDITVVHRHFEAMQQSQKRLRQIIEATRAGTWEWNLETGEVVFSERWAEIVGYTLAELDPVSLQTWKDLAHPDDFAQSQIALNRHFSEELSYYDFECRMRHKNGSWIWVQDRGQITERAADGTPIRMSGTHTEITDRKQMEIALRSSEEKFQKIFKAAPVLITVSSTETGKYLDANDAFCQVSGWSREEMMGLTSVELGWTTEKDRGIMLSLLEEGRLQQHKLVLHAKDGRAVHGFYSGELITVGGEEVLLSIAQDVSAIVQTEEALRSSVERFLQISEAAEECIWEVDAGGLYINVSPVVKRLLGYTPEELVGKYHFYDLWSPEDQKVLHPVVQEAFRRREPLRNLANTAIHKSGQPVLLETTGFPILGPQGELLGYRGVDRDVTERYAAESERQRLEKELNHLQRLESLGRLASGVSHDMNNVLGAIMAIGSLLQARHKNDPVISGDAEALLHAAIRGRDLVKGLRDFSRKELESATELDLTELARREADLLERTTLKRIRIVLDLAQDLPPILGEASAIGNALMNLCVNAMDVVLPGGTLTLITRDLGQGFVELAVQDNGAGMPPDVLMRAVEPFYTTKPIGKGTGLGLSHVYGTVKSHGGTLDIESEPGKGTRVSMTFPYLDDHPQPQGVDLSPVETPVRSVRILLVDDEEMIRNTAMKLFNFLGHPTQVSSSGLEVLRRLKAGMEVDLVVLDLNMPGMDGEETLSRLRILRPDLPVLIATGFGDDRIPSILKRFPNVRLLNKPFDLPDLERLLSSWP